MTSFRRVISNHNRKQTDSCWLSARKGSGGQKTTGNCFKQYAIVSIVFLKILGWGQKRFGGRPPAPCNRKPELISSIVTMYFQIFPLGPVISLRVEFMMSREIMEFLWKFSPIISSSRQTIA